jgi:hypothetical protein
MGGYGSGRYYRFKNRETTEETKRIDIRWLRKQGFLKPNSGGTLSWDCGGEPSGWIRYSMFDNRMELRYRIRLNGGDWQDVNQTVWFDETECNYGGCRKWFICPHCGRRVALLYGAQRLFLCRKCSDLVYASQMESDLDRLSRKARKVRQKLDIGNHDLFDPEALFDYVVWKPKGMHQTTFDRLRREEEWLQERINLGVFSKFGIRM